jgi:DNA-binding transcriptional LysR family regulator
MIDLRRLQHALALDAHRSYARAAEALHIPQPALTRSIQTLETAVGAVLFDRSRSGIVPTAVGEMLIARARGILLAADDLKRDIALTHSLDLGELTVGAGAYGAATLLGPALGRLSRRHPRLRVRVVTPPWQELADRLRAGEIDLFVTDTGEIERDPAFLVTPLLPHRCYAVCRRDHPLPPDADDLEAMFAYPLAGPHLPQHALDRLLRVAPAPIRRLLRSNGRVTLTCDSAAVVKSVLAHSDALSLMSAYMAVDELRSGALRLLANVNLGIELRVGIVQLRRRTPPPAARALIEELIAYDGEVAGQEQRQLPARRRIGARRSSRNN